MKDFRLLNYMGENGKPRPGLSVGANMVDLAEAVRAHEESSGSVGFSAASTLTVLEDWDAALPVLETIADGLEGGHPAARPLAEVTLKAPLLYPNAIFNAAANYYDHRAEMGNSTEEIDKTETKPYFFLKSPAHTVIGPGEQIRIPHTTKTVDWEAELGVVIGRYGRNLTQANARDIVAGYTIFNDLSARDLGRREDWQNFRTDWFAHKSFETSAPMGPWIVPAGAVSDPYGMKDRSMGQRRSHAGRQGRDDDLQYRGTDRISLRAYDAPSGRRHRDRNAGTVSGGRAGSFSSRAIPFE